jgi:transketolase
VLSEAHDGEPDVVLIATGSEVAVALDGQARLASERTRARVVSMPSWELFDGQPQAYRRAVLPPGVPAVAVEAGVSQGWQRYAAATASIERFGASAPGATVMTQLGITGERVAEAARRVIERGRPR